jgi:hypothetical protein
MKHVYLISAVLVSFLVIDTAGAAIAARRTAVVVQGPGGGVAVGASRTAVVRPPYAFAYNRDAADKATRANSVLVKDAAKKTTERQMLAQRTVH